MKLTDFKWKLEKQMSGFLDLFTMIYKKFCNLDFKNT